MARPLSRPVPSALRSPACGDRHVSQRLRLPFQPRLPRQLGQRPAQTLRHRQARRVPSLPPLLCHRHASRRSRHPLRPGNARPRADRHHPDLHPRQHRGARRSARALPPARPNRRGGPPNKTGRRNTFSFPQPARNAIRPSSDDRHPASSCDRPRTTRSGCF